MRIIFPREIVMIDGCCAFISTHYTSDGKPFLKHKYGRLAYEKENWQSHRLSFNLNHHKIPRNPCPNKKGIWEHEMVLHHCNHKWCIEPSHIYLGMHKQNSDDMWNSKTPEQMECFKRKMQLICNDPDYIERMKIATKGIKKTKEHKNKIRIAHERRRLQRV